MKPVRSRQSAVVGACRKSIIDDCPGSYILMVKSQRRGEVQVGRLGVLSQQPGFYLYVGSARGPGGIAARLSHHLRITDKPRWHLDYLRPRVVPMEVWYCCHEAHREKLWSEVIAMLPGATIPLAKFGASDSNDQSHLFFFAKRPGLTEFIMQLQQSVRSHPPLYRVDSMSN